jgi:hypothetical protein
MKNISNILLSLVLLFPQFTHSQKKSDAVAIAAVTGAAIGIGLAMSSSVASVKEAVERNMVEWVLDNKNHSNKTSFNLSLIRWEATKKEDLNNVSVLGFIYTVWGEKYSNYVLLNVCSQGWLNDYGVDFSKVKVYEIDKNNWSKIMLAYMNLSKENYKFNITDIENIPVIRNNKNKENSTIPLYHIKAINNTGILFQVQDNNVDFKFNFDEILTRSNTHTVIDIDEEYKLDFNEGNLGIYLKATGDLISLRRDFIVDITRIVFADKIPKTVY